MKKKKEIKQSKLLQNLIDLLSIESYSGKEKPVTEYLTPKLLELGFEVKIDEVGNVLAVRGKAEKYPMINAHMDSVKGYSYSRKNYSNFETFAEKTQKYKATRVLREEHCLACKLNKTTNKNYIPSPYTCEKKCEILKQLEKLVDSIEKKASKIKSCDTCSFFEECYFGMTQTEIQSWVDLTDICRHYENKFECAEEKIQKKEFQLYYNENTGVITSNETRPMGGDDKCGIAIALEVARKTGTMPMKLLFTVSEEVGCVGIKHIYKHNADFLKNVDYDITIDRRGGDNICLYSAKQKNCSNYFAGELAKFAIISGIRVQIVDGSIADVLHMKPYIENVVNISAGYYEPHTNKEYVKFFEVERIAKWVEYFLKYSAFKIESKK